MLYEVITDSVDHRIPDRYQGIDTSFRQSPDEQFEKIIQTHILTLYKHGQTPA